MIVLNFSLHRIFGVFVIVCIAASPAETIAFQQAFGFRRDIDPAVRHRPDIYNAMPTVRVKGTNGDSDNEEGRSKPKGFLADLQGMLKNFDDVVDDFLFKRMGAGEMWYGKRKYDPSGKVDGDYNGMGRTDLIQIEIARAKKEEIDRKRRRRQEEAEEQLARKEQSR